MRKKSSYWSTQEVKTQSFCIPFTYSLCCIICFLTGNVGFFDQKAIFIPATNYSVDLKTEHSFSFSISSVVSCIALTSMPSYRFCVNDFAFCYGQAHISIYTCVQHVIHNCKMYKYPRAFAVMQIFQRLRFQYEVILFEQYRSHSSSPVIFFQFALWVQSAEIHCTTVLE